jgi:hypothetical protein
MKRPINALAAIILTVGIGALFSVLAPAAPLSLDERLFCITTTPAAVAIPRPTALVTHSPWPSASRTTTGSAHGGRDGATNAVRPWRSMRRSFPALMWNGRFRAPSGDPFDNSNGFLFPPPEAALRSPLHDAIVKHLLQAQGQLPPTELIEVGGFTGTRGTIGPSFDFNHFGQAIAEFEFIGLEQMTGEASDRYRFRTAPLRNVALAPAFFHNGAFKKLEDATRHHLDVYESARGYDPAGSRDRPGPDRPPRAHRARAGSARPSSPQADRAHRLRIRRSPEVREGRAAGQASWSGEPLPVGTWAGAEWSAASGIRAVPELKRPGEVSFRPPEPRTTGDGRMPSASNASARRGHTWFAVGIQVWLRQAAVASQRLAAKRP